MRRRRVIELEGCRIRLWYRITKDAELHVHGTQPASSHLAPDDRASLHLTHNSTPKISLLRLIQGFNFKISLVIESQIKDGQPLKELTVKTRLFTPQPGILVVAKEDVTQMLVLRSK